MTPTAAAKRFSIQLPTYKEMPGAEAVEAAVLEDLPFWFDRESVGRLPKEETMRATRTIEYGEESLEAILKWDITPASRHGARTYEHGNTTFNDMLVLMRGSNRERYHLSRLLHAGKVTVDNTDIVYLAEPRYEGNDLFERARHSDIDPKQYIGLFSKVIAGVRRYTEQERIFHRDLTPHNIIVNGDDPVIIDWTLACEQTDAKPHNQPTAGKRSFTDPALFSKLTGKEKSYDVGSELWSLGITMLVADLGRNIYRLDYEAGKFCALDKEGNEGQSFLDADGRISSRAWNDYRNDLIKEMQPKLRRKLGDVIRKLTDLEVKQRYKHAEELQGSYEEAVRSPLSWRSSWMRGAAFALGLGVCGLGATALKTHQKNVELATRLQAEEQVTVVTSDYTQGLRMESNIANLEVAVNGKAYTRNPLTTTMPGIQVNPGDRLSVRLGGTTKPTKDTDEHNTLGSLPAEVRIEGYGAMKAHFSPDNKGSMQTVLAGEAAMAGPWPVYYQVPEDLQPGVYRLLVDVYPYTGEPGHSNHVKLRFPDQQHPLMREPIPLIVGDVPEEDRIVIAGVGRTGYDLKIGAEFARVSDERHEYIADPITYETFLPEDNWRKVSTVNHYGMAIADLDLPTLPQKIRKQFWNDEGDLEIIASPADRQSQAAGGSREVPIRYNPRAAGVLPEEVNRLLFITAKRDGRLLTYACVPVTQRNILWVETDWNEKGWNVGLPSRALEERCMQYRQQLLQDPR